MDSHAISLDPQSTNIDHTVITTRAATAEEASSLSPSTPDSIVLYKSYITSGMQLPLTPLVTGILSWFDIAPCQVNANFYRAISVATASIPLLRNDLTLTPQLFLNCYKLARKKENGGTSPGRKLKDGGMVGMFVRPRFTDFTAPGGVLPKSDKSWSRRPFVATGRWVGSECGPIRCVPNPEVDLGKPPPPLSGQDATALGLLRRGRNTKFEEFLKTPQGKKWGLEPERPSLVPTQWKKKLRSCGKGKRVDSTITGTGNDGHGEIYGPSLYEQASSKRRQLMVSSFYTEGHANQLLLRNDHSKRSSAPRHNEAESLGGCHSTPSSTSLESPAHFLENQPETQAVKDTSPVIPLKPDGTPVTRADSILECPAAASGAAGIFCLPRDIKLMEGVDVDGLMSTGTIFISRAMTMFEIGTKRLLETQKFACSDEGLKEENRQLKTMVEGLKKQCSDEGLKEENRQLKTMVEGLKKQCSEINTKAELHASEVQRLKDQLIAVNINTERVFEETRAEISHRAAAIDCLRAKNDELSQLLEQSRDEISMKSSVIRELEGFKEESKQMKAEVECLKKQCYDLKTKTEFAAWEVQRLANQMKAERAKFEKELGERRTEVCYQAATITDLREEKNELSLILKRARHEIALKSSVIKELQGIKEENDELKSKMEGLTKECSELKTQTDSSASEVRRLEDQMNIERGKFEIELRETKTELASQAAVIASLQAEKGELSSLLEQSKDEIDAKNSTLTEFQGLKEENEQLKSEVEDLTKKCYELKIITDADASEVRRLKDQMNTERCKVERVLEEARTKLSSQVASIASLRSEKDELSRLLEQYKDEIITKSSVIRELQSSVETLEGKVAFSMQRETIIQTLRDSALLAEQLADSNVKRARQAGYNDGLIDGRRIGWREFVELQQREPSQPQMSVQSSGATQAGSSSWAP